MWASSQRKTELYLEPKKKESHVLAQYGESKVIDVYTITGHHFSFCSSDGGAYVNVEMETGS